MQNLQAVGQKQHTFELLQQAQKEEATKKKRRETCFIQATEISRLPPASLMFGDGEILYCFREQR